MEDRLYFEQRAAQCRRWAAATTDQKTIAAMTALAEEFDAKAEACEPRQDCEDRPG